MNLRLAPESVRLRLSEEEAQNLLDQGHLRQEVQLHQGSFCLEVSLVEFQAAGVSLGFCENAFKFCVERAAFCQLLQAPRTKNSGLHVEGRGGEANLVLEIDILSQQKK